MQEIRPWSGCIGVPGMIAVLAFLAFWRENLLIALAAVVIVYLVIGFAMTLAKKFHG
jgi:cytochrome c oxidase assembly factor CtaG